MPLPKISLKISLREPRHCSWPWKDVLKKRTQLNILSQSKKRVRINEIVANVYDLKVNDQEVV